MTLLPLDQIGFGWRSHLSALWWLGLLHCRPRQFLEAGDWQQSLRAVATVLKLFLHAIPWLFIVSFLGRLFLHGAFYAVYTIGFTTAIGIAFGIALGIALGIAAGIEFRTRDGMGDKFAIGVNVGIACAIHLGIAFGIGFGMPGEINVKIASAIAVGIASGIAVGIASGIINGVACRLNVGVTSGIIIGIGAGIFSGFDVGSTFGVAIGITVGIATGIAVGIAALRVYYHAVHLFFVWPTAKGQWYPYHPVAWDNLCSVSFPRMSRLLVAYAEQFPDRGVTEIRRLIDHYPSQRMAALRTNATLIARQCARETRITALPAITAPLPEGEKGFLEQTGIIKTWIAEIGSLQRRLDATTRPFFREPIARVLRAEIEAFHGRVSGFHEPLASEFRKAALNWLEIADRQWRVAQAVTAKTPTPQVFRAGDPVDRNQEAFVERVSVVGELEGQIMLGTGCPGIILYGRRRMGKPFNRIGGLPGCCQVVTTSQNLDTRRGPPTW